MDVARSPNYRVGNNPIHEPNHRRVLFGRGSQAFSAELEQLLYDFLHRLAGLIKPIDGLKNFPLSCGNQIDSQSRRLFQDIKRGNIQRIGNCDSQRIALARQRHSSESAGQRLRHEPADLGRNNNSTQVD